MSLTIIASNLVRELQTKQAGFSLVHNCDNAGYKVQSLNVTISRYIKENQIKKFFTVSTVGNAITFKVLEKQAVSTVATSGNKVHIKTDDHDMEGLAGVIACMKRGWIHAFEVLNITEEQFRLLYPKLTSHVMIIPTKTGVALLPSEE